MADVVPSNFQRIDVNLHLMQNSHPGKVIKRLSPILYWHF